MARIPRIRRRRALAAAARRLAGGGTGIHHCLVCGSDRVCPHSWETDGEEHWAITLHCPECDVWRDVRITNAEAKAFDLELDRQVAEIQQALADIDREHMRAAADAFAAALERDLIDAGDFARW